MGRAQLLLSEELFRPLPFGAVEEQSYLAGYRCIAGLDEAGRGPLAGPVVAAAVVLPRKFFHPGINDSKSLTAKQREQMALVVKEIAVCWGLGVVEAGEIDRINVLRASLLAMAKATEALRPMPDYLLIDGNQAIPAELFSPHVRGLGFAPRQKTIIKGDQLCLSIAAASIVAKVARDEMMRALDELYPHYGFASHKGYGSAAHVEALKRFGPSPIHRKSFKPVRDCGAPRGEGGSLDSKIPR
jgi:ribonuclease HII